MIKPFIAALSIALVFGGVAYAQFEGLGDRLFDKVKEEAETALRGELGSVGACVDFESAKTAGACMESALAADIEDAFGRMLRGEALELHQGAVLSALATGKNASWTGKKGKAGGEVKVVDSDEVEAPIEIAIDPARAAPPPAIDLIGEDYHAVADMNVRKGPGVAHPVTGALSPNQTVTAIGKVRTANWYLIGDNGVATGYVYGEGLAPGAAAQASPVSSGPPATVETATVDAKRTCRTIEQTITDKKGRQQTETMRACMGPNGWELA